MVGKSKAAQTVGTHRVSYMLGEPAFGPNLKPKASGATHIATSQAFGTESGFVIIFETPLDSVVCAAQDSGLLCLVS